MKRLFVGTIEQMLEFEMEEHLAYEKNSVYGNNSGNNRNAYNRKKIISDYGESEIIRGVNDIFIACHDNLKGIGEAIDAIFPKTKQQLCIVHQIRNSTKFVHYKDRKAICTDLKKIYAAVNLDDAEYAKKWTMAVRDWGVSYTVKLWYFLLTDLQFKTLVLCPKPRSLYFIS